MTELFLNKNGNELVSPDLINYDSVNEKIWDLDADVFIPCAGSRMISEDQLKRMSIAGLSVISCGANVPFSDPEIFFGPIADKADESISLIPDFIANCGMARVFAYLMGNDLEKLEDSLIFEDTSNIIYDALKATHNKNNNKTGIAKTGFEIALNQLIK